MHGEKNPPALKIVKRTVDETAVSEESDKENDDGQDCELEDLRTIVQSTSVPGEEEVDDEDYEVEEIVDYKVCKKTKVGLYRVKWCGWGSESDTWEPLVNVEHCIWLSVDAVGTASEITFSGSCFFSKSFTFSEFVLKLVEFVDNYSKY